MSAKASAAVMNIKGARRISLHDLKDIFGQMPMNFIISFIRNQNKKLMNLPSSAVKPRLDPSGFFYQDINYVEASNFNLKTSVIDRNSNNVLCLELRVLEATGVPIPDETDVPRNTFLMREVGLLLFDKARSKYEGNAAYINADWKPEYEDRWVFESQPQDHTIYVKWGNFDEKMDSQFELIFEFITYVQRKGQLVQISCAYATVPVAFIKPGKHFFDIKGGAPLKEINIDDKDVRTNRTGWRSVVKSLSSKIKS